jgi:transposase
MLPITIRESTSHGGRSMPNTSSWIFFPPYSPELNPIARVWKLTRRLCLHNRYFEHLKFIVSAVEDEFANWTKRNDVLRRLCAII